MPTDQKPLTTAIEKRPAWLLAWQDYPHSVLDVRKARQLNRYAVELEDALRSECAAHAETLNERDAARWERDRAISQLAETREQLAQARNRVNDLVSHCDVLCERWTTMLGIARELARGLWVHHGPGEACMWCERYKANDGPPECPAVVALERARAAGILDAVPMDGESSADSGEGR